jgi:hypothetical protein
MKAIAIALLILLGAIGLFAQANATLGGTASDASGLWFQESPSPL